MIYHKNNLPFKCPQHRNTDDLIFTPKPSNEPKPWIAISAQHQRNII